MRLLRSAALLFLPVVAWMGASSLDLPADPALPVLPLVSFATPEDASADSLDRFGFPTWGYELDTLVVPKDVSLHAVFVSEGVSFDGADRLVKTLRETVRRDEEKAAPAAPVRPSRRAKPKTFAPDPALGAGDTLFVYRDSTELSHFVYEPDFRSYVVIKPGILPVVHEVMRPEVREERVVHAEVLAGGVAKTLAAQDAPASLADSLGAIFQHRFGLGTIRRGDSLAVVFPEARIDTTVTDTGAVLAVRIGSGDKAKYAFRYTTKDGRTDYYDDKGQNWRNYFLGAPIKGSIVSSPYSLARFHPVLEYWKPHLGTDYSAPFGAPILALADGVVLEAMFAGGNGLYVKMQHDATYTTAYLHMSRLGAGIVPGQKVRQGDVIGYVGQTGLATGPHTCLRFYRHGAQVDFQRQPWMAAPAVPVAERAAFERERSRLMARLATPPVASPLLAVTALARL